MGSGERGRLGNGRTGELIITSGRTVFDSEDTRSRFSTRRSQASDPSSISSRKQSDWKIVQTSTGPQHSLAVDSNECAMRFGPSPPHPPQLGENTHLPELQVRPRLGLCGHCRLDLGNQQDTLIDPKFVPATGKSPAARLSTPGRCAVPPLTGAGCMACRKMEDLWRWECRATLEQFPIRPGYHVSG